MHRAAATAGELAIHSLAAAALEGHGQ